MNKLHVGLFIAVAAVALYAFLFVHAVRSVTVEEVAVELQGLSLEGFTLDGDVVVKNNGFVSIAVDRIDYDVILPSGELLAVGNLSGGKISPGDVNAFPFEVAVEWTPSLELVIELLSPGASNVTISGNVHVDKIRVPFRQDIDIESYIKQFVGEETVDFIEAVTDFFGLA